MVAPPLVIDYSPPSVDVTGPTRGNAPLAAIVENNLNEMIVFDGSDNQNRFVFVDGTGAKVQNPLNAPLTRMATATAVKTRLPSTSTPAAAASEPGEPARTGATAPPFPDRTTGTGLRLERDPRRTQPGADRR